VNSSCGVRGCDHRALRFGVPAHGLDVDIADAAQMIERQQAERLAKRGRFPKAAAELLQVLRDRRDLPEIEGLRH